MHASMWSRSSQQTATSTATSSSAAPSLWRVHEALRVTYHVIARHMRPCRKPELYTTAGPSRCCQRRSHEPAAVLGTLLLQRLLQPGRIQTANYSRRDSFVTPTYSQQDGATRCC